FPIEEQQHQLDLVRLRNDKSWYTRHDAIFSSPVRANTLPGFGMAQPNGGARGTRTPQMLEYERQAEERQKEYDRMQEERERMQGAEEKIQQEQERIAQEEYEMRQYYEAEALKHAEEMREEQCDYKWKRTGAGSISRIYAKNNAYDLGGLKELYQRVTFMALGQDDGDYVKWIYVDITCGCLFQQDCWP
ncbi:hypothetical protein LCER1_G008706, partial [Lachnellula cervina]